MLPPCRQSDDLGHQVGKQFLLGGGAIHCDVFAVLAVKKSDELGRYDFGTLVQQLTEGMLPVGARFPQTTGPDFMETGSPLTVLDLPWLSISHCCRWAGNRCRAWL